MPAWENVKVYVAPEFRDPLSKRLAVSEVTLCSAPLAFDHVTVVPTLTVREPGTKSFLVMLTLFGEGGVCVALTCFAGVPLVVVLDLPPFIKLPNPVWKPQDDKINADDIRTDRRVKRFILPPCNGGNPTIRLLNFAVMT